MARTSNLTHLCFRRQHISTADRHTLCCSGATPVTGAGKLLHFKSSAAQFDPSTQHRLNVGSKEPEILVILCKGERIAPWHAHAGIQGRLRQRPNPFATRHCEMGGHHHVLATLLPGYTQYPLYKKLDGPRGQSERHWKSRPYRDLILGPSSLQTVVIPTTLARPFVYFMHMRVKTNCISRCKY